MFLKSHNMNYTIILLHPCVRGLSEWSILINDAGKYCISDTRELINEAEDYTIGLICLCVCVCVSAGLTNEEPWSI